MFESLKKLKYYARVALSRRGGESEEVQLPGRTIVIRSGGKGPAFVYLHSTLAESVRWLPFHDGWAKDFTLYSPVHPGFGKSGGYDQIDSIEDFAFHYVELFDALGLDEVILGGVSLGGWIAAEFAVRWPERVKKLWLSGSPGLWVDEEPLPDFFRTMGHPTRMRKLLFHQPEGAMAKLVIRDDLGEEDLVMAYRSMTTLARVIWERPYDPKLGDRLRRVSCPVLLVWGANDTLVPPSYAQEYLKHLPQAQLHMIPECGHLAMFEKETEFVETVRRFCLE